ncbi:MAG TPA: dephospho-CoA kinase [Acidimicrobiales bacterium]|nr:dephospho-CoA kinase [Acidimicrobiales bacterium]
MLVVGLTGGIGSGKSTVSAMLAHRGAVVVDADLIAREVVAPGGPAYDGVVERFGPGVVGPDGTIDRSGLAAMVFTDPSALADLNALTHPVIAVVVGEKLSAEAATDHVVILDVPLLVETERARARCAAVVVVDCPQDVAVRRLVDHRTMVEADVRSRMAAQATRDERLALADFVIDNSGSWENLEVQVDRCWSWIESLTRTG